jgi:hypothetical protein
LRKSNAFHEKGVWVVQLSSENEVWRSNAEETANPCKSAYIGADPFFTLKGLDTKNINAGLESV